MCTTRLVCWSRRVSSRGTKIYIALDGYRVEYMDGYVMGIKLDNNMYILGLVCRFSMGIKWYLYVRGP